MTANSNNPFVLPGLGQTGDMASNPLFASLEMMRQTFSTLSGANGLAKGLAMQPTLDPAELEKKISELKSVESWLKLNLSMLSSTIQGMEVQLATITTLQQFMTANAETQKPPIAKVTSPEASNTEGAQAWWNMLTQQFGQLAAATTASMSAVPGGSAAEVARTTQTVKKEQSAGASTTARPRSNTKKPITRANAKK